MEIKEIIQLGEYLHEMAKWDKRLKQREKKRKKPTCPQLGKGGKCTKEMREKYNCPFI